MAVAILRVEKGLDYTRFLGEDLQQTFTEESRPIQPNDSTTDLLANQHVHGSNDSLSRNMSQGTYRVSMTIILYIRTIAHNIYTQAHCTHTHTPVSHTNITQTILTF